MKSLGCVAVLLVLLAGCSAQNFVGTWTDPIESGGYGGNLHLCQVGNDIYGAYSEAGIMFGTIKGNTISGKWVEGGGINKDCINGEFFLALSDNGNVFSGWWTCGEKNPYKVKDTKAWAAQRVSVRKPSIHECAVLMRDDDDDASEKDNLEGTWIEENSENSHSTRAICLQDGGYSYESSYEYRNETNDVQLGKEAGLVFSHVVGSGYSVEQRKIGLSLVFLLADGSLGQFWWFALPEKKLDKDDVNDPELHYYRRYTRGSDFDRSDCQEAFANSVKYLEGGYFVDDEDFRSSSSSATNGSTEITISFLVVIICVLSIF